MTAPVTEYAPAPSLSLRKGEGTMDEETLQTTLGAVLQACEEYTDNELSPARKLATDYYHGRPFGDEEHGRSKVVLTDVRDAVRGVLPSLLRVFFGPERAVEFRPDTKEAIERAEQATEYVNYVFTEENNGFMQTHSVLKDGLIRKLGIFKWGWDATEDVKAYKFSDLSQEQVELLAQEPGVAITHIEEAPPSTLDAPKMYSQVEVTRRRPGGHAVVMTLPPEEFIFTRDARGISDGLCFAHRTKKSRGDLLAMGISEEDIEEYAGPAVRLDQSEEELARNPGREVTQDPDAGEANIEYLYIEAYPLIDFDGDGVAELRKICTLGPGYHPVKNTPVDERPFAVFCPDPEPHAMLGLSWADLTMDLQRINSQLLRYTFDSAGFALFPRPWYVEGQVNVQDLLNTEIGAPIRTKAPGMVGEFPRQFIGGEMLGLMGVMAEVKESRTGQNKGALGLDADALQSTTKSAADAAVTSSQQQVELLARIFAEMTLKPLYRGLLRLLVKHQPRARMLRLRNKWVEMDPRVWDSDMEVSVNVALGAGLSEKKIAGLAEVITKQELILQTLGPDNPLVSLVEYRNTVAQVIELLGHKDASRYIKEIDPNWQPQAPGPPPPSPEMMLAEQQIQIERERLALDEMKIRLEDDRERDKQAAEFTLKRHEIELKHAATLDANQLRAEAAKERATTHSSPAEGG